MWNGETNTARKMSKYAVFLGPYLPEFSPNKGKYGPGKLRILTLLPSETLFVFFYKKIVEWSFKNFKGLVNFAVKFAEILFCFKLIFVRRKS